MRKGIFMKKIAAMLLVLALLSASSCIKIVVGGEKESSTSESTRKEGSGKETTTEKKSSETGKEETTTADTKAESKSGSSSVQTEEEPVAAIHLRKYTTQLSASVKVNGSTENKCRLQYSGYSLEDEVTEETQGLSWSLVKSYDNTLKDFEYSYENLKSAEGTDLFDNLMTGVVRSDSRVVSIRYERSYIRNGSWHLEKSGMNLDPRTGSSIDFSDVVTDPKGLAKKMEEKLTDTYAAEFTSNNFLKSGDYFVSKGDNVDFTIGYEGLTVYFNEGEYENDWMTATVYYDEAPGLFSEYYTKAAENYIVPFIEEEFAQVDVDGDGKREFITVNGEISSDDRVNWTVRVNGNAVEVKDYTYDGDLYLARCDGKYYVLIFQHTDNDYATMASVDLATRTFNVPEDRNYDIVLYRSHYEYTAGSESHLEEEAHALTDPENMLLESRVELLGNQSRTGIYALGKQGYPVPVNTEFGTAGVTVVEARKDIKCDVVNKNGKVIGEAIILKGELLYLARSDYSTYADLQMAAPYSFESIDTGYNGVILRLMDSNPGLVDSETIYRLPIERKDWRIYINGEAEEDVFNGIMYAG